MLYLAVASGTAIGGVLRAAVSLGAVALAGEGFPWGTLIVNVAGSFAICFYAGITAPEGRLLAGPRQRHFVMTGICGGFTTFSVFSLETLHLAASGAHGQAAAVAGLALACWLVAGWAGLALAARLNRLEGA